MIKEKSLLRRGLTDYGSIFEADFMNTNGRTEIGDGVLYMNNQDLLRESSGIQREENYDP